MKSKRNRQYRLIDFRVKANYIPRRLDTSQLEITGNQDFTYTFIKVLSLHLKEFLIHGKSFFTINQMKVN